MFAVAGETPDTTDAPSCLIRTRVLKQMFHREFSEISHE